MAKKTRKIGLRELLAGDYSLAYSSEKYQYYIERGDWNTHRPRVKIKSSIVNKYLDAVSPKNYIEGHIVDKR